MSKFKLKDRVIHKHLDYHGTVVEEEDDQGRFGAIWDERPGYRACHDDPDDWELIETEWDQ